MLHRNQPALHRYASTIERAIEMVDTRRAEWNRSTGKLYRGEIAVDDRWIGMREPHSAWQIHPDYAPKQVTA